MKIRLGTRGSRLALIQTEMTVSRIKEKFPEADISIVPIKTAGDIDRVKALSEFGGKGAFALKIEEALSDGKIDIAVHSAKDLPQELYGGLEIRGVLKRDDFRDVLVMNGNIDCGDAAKRKISNNDAGNSAGRLHDSRYDMNNRADIIIGTGSLRRRKALERILREDPDMNVNTVFREIRGNVETRLGKVLSGEYDGTILSAAGLVRLGIITSGDHGNISVNTEKFPEYKDLSFRVFSDEEMVPAPCQGIIALETRRSDLKINSIVDNISDPDTFTEFMTERHISELLGGNCDIPAGAHAEVSGDSISIIFTEDAVSRKRVGGKREEALRIAEGMVRGRVFLVGAGCGSADMITVKGLKILKTADTVIYDDLIDKRLLDAAPENAVLIKAGKRGGQRSITQDEINRILIDEARKGRTVVRLKGGDPFVFGRGGEEIIALREAGISCSTVPGVTSAVAVPEAAGIPVTHRNTARSFHVITGHTAQDILPENMHELAGLKGTLVFLMGLGNIKKISETLIMNGMSGDTPAAVVSDSGRKSVRGKLEDIAEISEKEKILSPAVIVIGETAGFDMSSDIRFPLDGVSISLAGTESFAKKAESVFSSLGAEISWAFRMSVKEYRDNPEFDFVIMHPDETDRIIFTSPNGVRIFKNRLKRLHADIRSFAGLKFAVLGKGTRAALEDIGIIPDLIPPEFTTESLGNTIAAAMKEGERITVLRAARGSEILDEILDHAGADYRDIRIYDVKHIESPAEKKITGDAMIFASASGVDEFFENGYTISENTKVFCIGDITGKALSAHGITECITAQRHDIKGLADCVLNEFRGK